jgi:hypothetical protein
LTSPSVEAGDPERRQLSDVIPIRCRFCCTE